MRGGPTIVGVSANFHDAACCLVRHGKLVAAIQEERLTRIKHDPSTPAYAFRACLAHAGLDVTDVDCIAYYEDPALKAQRINLDKQTPLGTEAVVADLKPVQRLRRRLGYEGEIHCFRHHLSHAASAFYPSGFDSAAVLTIDGVGEWTSTGYWRAGPKGLELLEEVRYPHSLGLLYSTVTAYLGFSVNDGEYKVMGLAALGRPTLLDKLRRLISSDDDAQFRLDMRYFDFRVHDRMYSKALETLLEHPRRQPDEKLNEFHANLASSVQALLEEVLIQKVRYLHKRTNSDRLCLAGGVALNCVANGRVHRDGPFAEIFVQPAADDAGGAIGAAALAHIKLCPETTLDIRFHDAFLGPTCERDAIWELLCSTPIPYDEFAEDRDELIERTALHLASGHIVGWFQGRMEFGPRALGGRSILADPRSPHVRDRINTIVKRRESFRPFGPAVLYDRAHLFFELAHPSPFMVETCGVRPSAALPAVTHVDGSARVQTVDRTSRHPFARLLGAFDRLTGCPALLNTSFNMNDEPIVCTPEDALICFLRSEIAILVLETFMIERSRVPFRLIEAVRRSYVSRPLVVPEHVYTLV